MAGDDINWQEEGRNMYGCKPCPHCGSDKRYGRTMHERTDILCDECGHIVRDVAIISFEGKTEGGAR